MANSVYSNIRIIPSNEAGMTKLNEIFQRAKDRPETDGNLWFGYLFVDGKEGSPTAEEVTQYSWTTEHIGPKWCHIEDLDEMEDEISFRTESAWSPPENGLIKILEEIEVVDPKVRGIITYEDEMPNFIGAYVYEGSELVDGAEDDDEEIREAVFAWQTHLKEHWDESNDEWKCDEDGDMLEESYEAEDQYREFLYEWICNRHDELVDEAIASLDKEEQQ